MRLYKATHDYPAYTHTSWNLELGKPVKRTGLHISFHLKHFWGDGGFVFAPRIEIDLSRNTDRATELRKEMQNAKSLHICSSCSKEEWGEAGLRHPKDWEFISMMDFCGDCCRDKTYYELLND